MAGESDRVKITALVVLGVIVVCAITAIAIAAVLTDRDLTLAEQLTGGATILVALLGGVVLWRRNGHT